MLVLFCVIKKIFTLTNQGQLTNSPSPRVCRGFRRRNSLVRTAEEEHGENLFFISRKCMHIYTCRSPAPSSHYCSYLFSLKKTQFCTFTKSSLGSMYSQFVYLCVNYIATYGHIVVIAGTSLSALAGIIKIPVNLCSFLERGR